MRLFKLFIVRTLTRAVQRFFHTNPHIKLVVVVGSIGKTGTKTAIAHVLSGAYEVRTNRGNLNAALSAPLEILGIDGPKNPRDPIQWIKIIHLARKIARQHSTTEIIVQECGTDRPGDIPQFASYLRPDIAVVTAISPEHMEFFHTLDAVAHEEMSISHVAQMTIFNQDDINPSYYPLIVSAKRHSYGSSHTANTWIQADAFQFKQGFTCYLHAADTVSHPVTIPVVGTHQLRVLAGAAAVATTLGMSVNAIAQQLAKITPVEGRLQLLPGVNGATLLDDSYNASPLAMIAALDTLYCLPHLQKIAVLGGMNELGENTACSHVEVAQHCDPRKLNLVVTVGKLANTHLAPVARKKGCTVIECTTAPEAAKLLHAYLTQDTAILFKGSQGGIYLEEAIKPLLKDPSDTNKLVRQSKQWQDKKKKFFTQHS